VTKSSVALFSAVELFWGAQAVASSFSIASKEKLFRKRQEHQELDVISSPNFVS